MKALCWNGANDLRVETVRDPEILDPQDIILKVNLSSACGSDIHLVHGLVPTMKPGDIIGHEFMGEVVETGREVSKLSKGDRVTVVSVIGCGKCYHCNHDEWSLCDNSNTHREPLDTMLGHTTGAIFGYSHAFGGYAGSHAEYIRVPYAEFGSFKIPDNVTEEQALFVSDACPTGFMAADMCGIQPGDVVAVFGAGGVGQMAMRSAYLLGADRVIAIDPVSERLQIAQQQIGVEILDPTLPNFLDVLQEMTGNRGPDRCIDAVGMEADSANVVEDLMDKAEQLLRLETDRPTVLRQAIMACRKGGTVSVVGVYAGFIDKVPFGAAMNKGLTLRMGQQYGQKYAERLLNYIANGDLDPSYLLSKKLTLEEGPAAYQAFAKRQNGLMRPVLAPGLQTAVSI